ncbi:hypothetical protein [Acinetobacter pittii]|uniref:hypothetical protein n=1 Tax=Acinetobacter pittii TaxID=48296 RepID=UPI0021CD3710|nr:hypothetical protein [Acinetobacter pittii]MCU4469222.1 hypothetical protein [Acinetobacter pittii]
MSNNVDENFSDMNDDDFINYLKKQEQIKEFRSEKDYEEQRKRRKTMANSNMRCDSFKSHMIINKLSKFL